MNFEQNQWCKYCYLVFVNEIPLRVLRLLIGVLKLHSEDLLEEFNKLTLAIDPILES